MPVRHQLLALLVAGIWGTNFVLIRQGLDELPPTLFVALRFLFSALPLVFFLPAPRVPRRALALYGLLIGCGQFGLLFRAMESSISPGLASLVIQLQAPFTILLAVATLGEPVRARQGFALLVCLGGLATIALFTDGSATPLGVALVLLAALAWAAGNLVIKRVGPVDAVAFLAWSSLAAAPPLLAAALWLDGWQANVEALRAASARAWLIVAWQAVGNTLIGYGVWNWLLERHPAAAVAPWALAVPVFGMGTSWWVLGEPLPWWKLAAAGMILAGLALNLHAARHAREIGGNVAGR